MQFITLITDLGLRDYYAGMIKGLIYREVPEARIVDITHEVTPNDIVEAAYNLQQSYRSFPKGTLHLILVSNHENPDHCIAFRHKGHWFIGPDNGLFSLVFDEAPTPLLRLDISLRDMMEIRHKLGGVIAAILAGPVDLSFGTPTKDYVQRLHLHPVVTHNEIRGSVMYIDRFGNTIINVRRELFEQVRRDRAFEIYFKRNHPITRLTSPSEDIEVGEPYGHFNDAGFLEIAVNMGNASELFNLRKDETIQIQFSPE